MHAESQNNDCLLFAQAFQSLQMSGSRDMLQLLVACLPTSQKLCAYIFTTTTNV